MSHVPPEPIAIVGSGRVARALGRALIVRGGHVVAVASPTAAHSREAASFMGPTVRAVAVDEIPPLASRVIIAVTDRHISDAARELAGAHIRNAIVVHTSGASGMGPLQVLCDSGAACGMMHPLQTLGDPAAAGDILGEAPFAVLGDERAAAWARAVVEGLGGWVVQPREADLASYHAAAVLAGNSMWAVIDAAVTLMGDAGIAPDAARKALAPLARTSLEHALGPDASATLTGPVARGDKCTVQRHLEALEKAPPHVGALYRAILLNLAQIAEKGGPSDEHLQK